MTARPWMPLYVGDYLADTLHLTCEQHGAYLLAICAYWCNGGPLPDDDRYLAAVTKSTMKEWRSNLRPVLSHFFGIADGMWRHKRIDAELVKAQARTNAGVQGAAKRWQCKSQPQEDALLSSNATSRAPARAGKTVSSNGPVTEIYEAAYHAANAISDDDEKRHSGNCRDNSPATRPLLGRPRKQRGPPSPDRGLDS